MIHSLQFHTLKCTCGHASCLTIHGYYSRHLKTPNGVIPLRICRVYCHVCHKTHALLPSSLVPYSQISAPEQADIILRYLNRQSQNPAMEHNPYIDESCIRHIIRSYLLYFKERLLSFRILLVPFSRLTHLCFSYFGRQFMQVKCTPNTLFLNTTSPDTTAPPYRFILYPYITKRRFFYDPE